MVSCGTDKRHFKIDGRLLNLNQGEFYVYSPDGSLGGVDTIKVQAGRFTYKVECNKEMTLMIVFPNFTEQPVFAAPGKSVDIKGDASHLKEMTVKGTKANELMNQLREQIANASPAEIQKYAKQFVEDHPESIVSIYVVRNFFLQKDNPDFRHQRQAREQRHARKDRHGGSHSVGNVELQQRVDAADRSADSEGEGQQNKGAQRLSRLFALHMPHSAATERYGRHTYHMRRQGCGRRCIQPTRHV